MSLSLTSAWTEEMFYHRVVHQTYLLNIKYFSLLPNGSLLISCSGREEEGRYQCRATNSLDQITKTVSLDVQGRDWTRSRVESRENFISSYQTEK